MVTCCCGTCVIYGDDFGDGSLTGWTETFGNWTEASGVVSTNDADAILLANTAHPLGNDKSQIVAVDWQVNVVGLAARVYIGYDSADDYMAVEVEVDANGCGTLRYYANIGGGGEAQVGDDQPLGELDDDTAYSLLVCYDYDQQILIAKHEGLPQESVNPGVSVVGDQAGLGTGGAAGKVIFDNFQYIYHETDQSGCPDCNYDGNEFQCLIGEDSFTRADSDSPGCLWTEAAGDWDIASNELKSTSSGTATNVRYVKWHDESVYASVKIKLPSVGAKGRVYICYDSADGSYLAAEIEAHATCGKLRLFEYDGATETEVGGYTVQVGVGIAASVFHTLSVCYSAPAQVLSASLVIGGGGTARHHANGIDATGITKPKAGLMTSTTSGDYYFDDFQLQHHATGEYGHGSCPNCAAPAGCESPDQPSYDGTDLINSCDYEEASGSWAEVTSGDFGTADDNARLLWVGGTSGMDRLGLIADYSITLDSSFSCDEPFAEFIFIVAYKDTNNYLFAQVISSDGMGGGGTFKLFRRSGGTNTQVGTTVTYGGVVEDDIANIRLCYDASTTEFIGILDGTQNIITAAADTGGRRFGVGTGAVTAGTVRFTHLAVNHHATETDCDDCSPEATCEETLCQAGVTTKYVKARIQGVQDHPDFPDACGILNRTFLVPLNTCNPNSSTHLIDCSNTESHTGFIEYRTSTMDGEAGVEIQNFFIAVAFYRLAANSWRVVGRIHWDDPFAADDRVAYFVNAFTAASDPMDCGTLANLPITLSLADYGLAGLGGTCGVESNVCVLDGGTTMTVDNI
jgi:hypothetical protein